MKLFSLIMIMGKYTLYFLLLFSLISSLFYLITNASNDRAWDEGQQKVSTISIDENQLINIKNLRDINWTLANEETFNQSLSYKEFQFQLTDLKSMELAVSHFSAISEIAHVFLMFTLNDGSKFGFSIEARREYDEKYSILGGLFAKFELINLLATKNDLIGLRKARNEQIYLFPTKASSEQVQQIFEKIIENTNQLATQPALYHLLFKNCTTGVVDLVSPIADLNYPRLVQSFMPGDSGKALFKMGLIQSDETDYEAVRKAALVR